MAEQRCEYCRFFDVLGSDEVKKGACRRYPPQIVRVDLGEDSYIDNPKIYCFFPELYEWENCGEWRPVLDGDKQSVFDDEWKITRG